MQKIFPHFTALLIAAFTGHASVADTFKEMSMSMLEQRLEEIDTRLEQLANYSLGSGIGAIGYRSQSYGTADRLEWIEIDFGTTVPLDEVVLVPAIRRDTKNGFQADGFPLHFKLIAGCGEDRTGLVVAEYTCTDRVLPRIAPFIIPCNGIEASWIRLEADELSTRAFDERFVLQLSEIMAFSREVNVALNRPVRASSSNEQIIPAWGNEYLVDGFLPYLMDAAQGQKSVAYLTPTGIGSDPSFTIDLGESSPISIIHLHTVDQSDTLPQAFAGDFGIPEHMVVEGANHADFSDAKTLLDLQHSTLYKTGPIMMHAFPETVCRYVRFRVVKFSATTQYGNIPPQTGFAEVEILSRGKNMALGRTVTPSFRGNTHLRPIANLTDGLNIYGKILPLREWVTQLAQRHELETERPLLVQELNRRYARQKTNLRRMGWLIAFMMMCTIIIILIDRIIRQRAVYRTREQIAADLHDELGANLHAIGLLADLAQASSHRPEKHSRLLQRMRALTERTGAAARHCTNLLEARGLYGNLVDDMQRTAARITADLEHDLTFDGEEILSRLKPRKRIDLFLFYKECLINVIRHSGATRVSTQLSADPDRLDLTITDNGHGLNGDVPASLKRRARLLGAQVISEKPESGGTRISLSYEMHGRWGFLRRNNKEAGRLRHPASATQQETP